jgi:hypothetical protein
VCVVIGVVIDNVNNVHDDANNIISPSKGEREREREKRIIIERKLFLNFFRIRKEKRVKKTKNFALFPHARFNKKVRPREREIILSLLFVPAGYFPNASMSCSTSNKPPFFDR